jgi:hypothetical protein
MQFCFFDLVVMTELCSPELQNVQVSDTTEADSSNADW